MKKIQISESRLRHIIREELMNEIFSSEDFTDVDAGKVAKKLIAAAKQSSEFNEEKPEDAVNKAMSLLKKNKTNKGFLSRLFDRSIEQPSGIPTEEIEAAVRKLIDPRAAKQRRLSAGA